MTNKINWNAETEATLTGLVGDVEQVSQADLHTIAEEMGTTARSIGSKLRKMGFDVQKAADLQRKSWSEEDQAELTAFLAGNEGAFTYAEAAAKFLGGKFSAKALQGKILSMELTGSIKPTEKVEVARSYTPEQEAVFLEMASAGATIEAIAAEMGKEIASVRGKALSFTRTVEGFTMPVQATSTAKSRIDPIAALGDISAMTVADIATKIEKTERGVKTALTRRSLTCADYDGAKKAAKNAAKAQD